MRSSALRSQYKIAHLLARRSREACEKVAYYVGLFGDRFLIIYFIMLDKFEDGSFENIHIQQRTKQWWKQKRST